MTMRHTTILVALILASCGNKEDHPPSYTTLTDTGGTPSYSGAAGSAPVAGSQSTNAGGTSTGGRESSGGDVSTGGSAGSAGSAGSEQMPTGGVPTTGGTEPGGAETGGVIVVSGGSPPGGALPATGGEESGGDQGTGGTPSGGQVGTTGGAGGEPVGGSGGSSGGTGGLVEVAGAAGNGGEGGSPLPTQYVWLTMSEWETALPDLPPDPTCSEIGPDDTVSCVKDPDHVTTACGFYNGRVPSYDEVVSVGERLFTVFATSIGTFPFECVYTNGAVADLGLCSVDITNGASIAALCAID